MMYYGHVKEHTCPHDAKSRAIWGCDAPAEKPVWELPCYVCLGRGTTLGGDECPKCKGEKNLPQERCPNNTVSRNDALAFKAYRMFKDYQIFPAQGGWAEQTSYFIEVLELCDTVHAIYSKNKKDREESVKKLIRGNRGRRTA